MNTSPRNPKPCISYVECSALCDRLSKSGHQSIPHKIGQHWYAVRFGDAFIYCNDGRWRDCAPCPVA